MEQSNQALMVSVPVTRSINEDVNLATLFNLIGVEFATSLIWVVDQLEYTVASEQERRNKVEATLYDRAVLSGQHLFEVVPLLDQLVEGGMAGYRSTAEAQTFSHQGWAAFDFTTSSALLAIEAIDGCWLDVYLRDREQGEKIIQALQQAHWEPLP